ncbi:MAG TPA: glycoside hydrolase family 38 C-terminal domain-containing protein [Candidatus Bathyarchaeia archaeon]|nr:glycoside hydrolase family 38 C-terminal domain-containing protein [Candidatus Bathyarchaeia archaeon]
MDSENVRKNYDQGINRPVVYLVPHTHYDAIWVFTKEDYFYINIELILKQVVDLIKGHKEYKFTIEQTFLLEHIENNYPKLFADITNFIKQGRIEIAGGQYLLCDAMLPHGEVLIREISEGRTFINNKFDQKNIVVAWGADEFGFNAQWPQILLGCGYKYFAFRRGAQEAKPSEFLWEGLDGSRILSHWMPLGYRAGLDLTKLEESYLYLKEFATTNQILMPSGSGVSLPQAETSDVVRKWNEGIKNKDLTKSHNLIDHRHYSAEKEQNKNNEMPQIIISTPSEFFTALEKNLKMNNIEEGLGYERQKSQLQKQLLIRKGEMYSGKLSEVFPDCTSSRMWIKQGAKGYENMLLMLERWNAVLCLLDDYTDIFSDLLRNYWRKILFIAMHDALPGTGIDDVYGEIQDTFNTIDDTVKKTLHMCLLQISKHIVFNKKQEIKSESSDNDGTLNIIVFNSLAWRVKNWTEVILEFEDKEVKTQEAVYGISCLRSTDDRKIVDIEIIDLGFHHNGNKIKRAKIGFIADVPALGYRTYEVIKSDVDSSKVANITAFTAEITKVLPRTTTKITQQQDQTSFHNPEFSIKVDPETAIFTISKDGKQYVKGNEIYLEEEIGDLYYHRENLGLLKSELGEGIKYGSFKPDSFQVVTGNIRSHITFKSKYFALRWPYRLADKLKPLIYRHSFIDIEKEIFIYKDLSRIDLVTHIHDRHPHSRIRVKFDSGLKQLSPNLKDRTNYCNSYWSGTQFGAIERPTNLHYSDTDIKGERWAERPTGIFPSLEWIDYSDENQKRGVSILHQGIPSHEVRDGSIYLTLLRSVELLSSDGIMGPCIPTPDANETRPYKFRYSVLPHDGCWKDVACYRHGMELNMPLMALQMKSQNDNIVRSYGIEKETELDIKKRINDIESKGYLMNPNSFSFLEIEPKNIVLSTLKLSDNIDSDNKYHDERVRIGHNNIDKNSAIIRFYETEGRKETRVRLTFGKTVTNVSITDLLEHETKNGTEHVDEKEEFDIKIIENHIVELEVGPFKIVTLKVKF